MFDERNANSVAYCRTAGTSVVPVRPKCKCVCLYVHICKSCNNNLLVSEMIVYLVGDTVLCGADSEIRKNSLLKSKESMTKGFE